MITATKTIELTEDQRRAVEAVIEFAKSRNALLTIGGYAGTGKTTTVAIAIAELRKMERFENLKVAFVCFTGKASTVLRDKLQNAGALSKSDYCGTIHGLIYRPILENGRIKGWEKIEALPFDIVIIDEASMVGEIVFDDLKSYGAPIVAVGDHGQLPPLFSKYNLMQNPQVRLEKIHRQAEGNPIIQWSMMARNGEDIPFGHETNGQGASTLKTDIRALELVRTNLARASTDWMILCGMNRTRVLVNSEIRNMLGRIGDVKPDEKVICLRNNRKEKIFNGMGGKAIEVSQPQNKDFIKVKVKFDLMGFEWSGEIFKHQFGQQKTLRTYGNYTEMDIRNLFDFGYCITVHKSQGSQAETVMLIEERMPAMSDDTWNRWLYTAVTRSSKHLIIVGRK